mmetsp:Transcript_21127/g.66911  ORF Transcript_21127/g.66911 Transcript_21127/m.66911 type:complete len:257 (-) Transcript_21127:454-1224(-)
MMLRFFSVRRSSLAYTSSFFLATTLAICCCCRSWRSDLSPCAPLERALRSIMALMSPLMESRLVMRRFRSDSRVTGSLSTACTVSFCLRLAASSLGSFSRTMYRFCEVSSASCDRRDALDPSAVFCLISRRRPSARWYLASLCSSCIFCCLSSPWRLTSSSCWRRSLVAASWSSCRLGTLSTLALSFSMRACSCPRSSSMSCIRTLSLLGSWLPTRICSTTLWLSTNCPWSSWFCWNTSITSGSWNSSSGICTLER